MKSRAFRSAALVLGGLGVPSLGLQVWKAWPPSPNHWSSFGVQAAVLYAFVMYGSGLAYQTPVAPGAFRGTSGPVEPDTTIEPGDDFP